MFPMPFSMVHPQTKCQAPEDVSNLRGVLQARRENSQQQFLAALTEGRQRGEPEPFGLPPTVGLFHDR